MLAGLLRETYVDVAERDFQIEGRAQTVTRVSLLTGIHRKEVRRLLEDDSDPELLASGPSLGAQLVARWTADPRFLDSDQRPRPLPRRGADLSFDALVESVSKDIRPRAILDEWLRLGVVSIDETDRVALHVSAFIPERGFDEKAFFFGRNVRDHVAAAAHNLRGSGDPLLERSVFYDLLRPESVAELETMAGELGADALARINRRAFELQQRDEAAGGGSARMSFGVFFFRDRGAETEQ